ncbi:MAG: FAD:protein FMN transferase [Lachnospiraceae bacterium]
MKKTVQAAIVALLMVIILLLIGTGWERKDSQHMAGEQKYSITYTDVLDTVTQIVGYAESRDAFEEKAEQLHQRLQYYNELFDIYHSYPDVNNMKDINDEAGKSSVKADEEIIDLLKLSKEVYQITGGQTNVAMGSVLRIWHDYRTQGTEHPEQAKLPAKEELARAAEHCDPENLMIDEETHSVYLKDKEMSLDVGSIGKGYAVELLGEYAKEIGLENVLISVGGNVLALGEKPDGSKWKLGIQNPDTQSEENYICSVAVKDKCVVTSGDYQRYYTVDGKRYCHIIDPDTGEPAEYVRSVTVITEKSGLADGLSTALFVMPVEEGKKLTESLEGVDAMWVLKNGEMEYSSGFEQYLVTDAQE